MPPRKSHKRALSSGEVPTAKKPDIQRHGKHTPSWTYVITRTTSDPYEPSEFQLMSVCQTLQDANFNVKHLQRAGDEYILYKDGKLWEETRDENGCLCISAVDEEGSGVEYKVIRMPLTKAGTVKEPSDVSGSDGEGDGDEEDEEESEDEGSDDRKFDFGEFEQARRGGGQKVNRRGTGRGDSRYTSRWGF